jgi:translation initiation factor IF-2
MNNGKVRIYELSKELNLDNKDIKEICEQLNIAVKSHSSTITADDAVRVRSVAEKSPRTENNHHTQKDSQQKGNNALNAPAKRKQQILAVHHRTDNPNSPTSSPAPNFNSQSPRLVSPPSRPKAPNLSGSPEKSSWAAKPSSQNESSDSADRTVKISTADTNGQSSPKVNTFPPNRLAAPPSRPQSKKSASRNLIQSPIKPKVRSVEQPQGNQRNWSQKRRKKRLLHLYLN